MKNRGMGIKHPKIRGEWVELRFMMRAIELELHLNKPWGEVMPYDFAVEHEGQFVRVQVKSTMFIDRGGYSCTVRGSNGPYEGDPFDYLAAYIFQEDLWYIIPAEMVVGQGSIALYPEGASEGEADRNPGVRGGGFGADFVEGADLATVVGREVVGARIVTRNGGADSVCRPFDSLRAGSPGIGRVPISEERWQNCRGQIQFAIQVQALEE